MNHDDAPELDDEFFSRATEHNKVSKNMTRDDIIRWAQEAGLETHPRKGEVRIGSAIITGCDSTEQVMRFANLVEKAAAVAERERIAKWVEEQRNDIPATGIEFASAIRASGDK